jgi:hypothetical protein
MSSSRPTFKLVVPRSVALALVDSGYNMQPQIYVPCPLQYSLGSCAKADGFGAGVAL